MPELCCKYDVHAAWATQPAGEFLDQRHSTPVALTPRTSIPVPDNDFVTAIKRETVHPSFVEFTTAVKCGTRLRSKFCVSPKRDGKMRQCPAL